MWRKSRICLWGVGLPLLLTSVLTAQEAVLAPPPPPTPTLWNFLGIPQGVRKVQGAVRNPRGNHPGLEPKPPLRAIGDPMNLFSKNDAIKQAAKVKQEEDLKPQKIKAIKYLASIGCGCYDKDGEITKALIAASEDCTEEVRMVTMEELYNLSSGQCCGRCGTNCCCKEPLLRKLAQIAYEKDEFGCYIEPSQRVREGAARVLQSCCPNPVPPLMESERPPQTTPPVEQPQIEPERPRILPEEIRGEQQLEEERRRALQEQPPISMRLSDAIPARLASMKSSMKSSTPQPVEIGSSVQPGQTVVNRDVELTASPNPKGGVVIGYDPHNRVAYVHFEDQQLIAEIDSCVYIKVDPARGRGFRGTWKVVAAAKGRANLVPVDSDGNEGVVPGDHVMFGAPPVAVVPVGFTEE